MLLNHVSDVVHQLRQLNPQGHHLIVDVPPQYHGALKDMEERANGHVEAELQRLQAHYEAKQLELEQLVSHYNEALTFATESARLNFEWYFDQIFLKSIAVNLDLRQAKAKIQTLADEMVAAWQSTAEAMYSENEGLWVRLGRYEELVKDLRRAKKPDRIISLLAKFEG